MKINPIVFSLFLLSISQHMHGQEKLVPMKAQGDPELIAKSKEVLESAFGEDSKVSIRSVEPFDNPAWKSLFPNSSPSVVQAVISHPDSGHAAVISFIVSSSGQRYVVDYRSMEPSSFLKVLKNQGKRIESVKDAEAVAKAFIALCWLTLTDEIEAKKTSEGYTVSLPTQSVKGAATKPIQIDLELMVDSESRLVSVAKAKSMAPSESFRNEEQNPKDSW
jgi:hypothetical protein